MPFSSRLPFAVALIWAPGCCAPGLTFPPPIRCHGWGFPARTGLSPAAGTARRTRLPGEVLCASGSGVLSYFTGFTGDGFAELGTAAARPRGRAGNCEAVCQEEKTQARRKPP